MLRESETTGLGFVYRYLNSIVNTKMYSKIFEIAGDDKYFWIFNSNNQKKDENKFIATISVSRI